MQQLKSIESFSAKKIVESENKMEKFQQQPSGKRKEMQV
jgi:hypothetical protein